jgi:hypothetical protein
MLVLFPIISLVGFAVYAVVFLLSRNSNISASIGFASIVFNLWWFHLPIILLFYTLILLLFIPVKKLLDSGRLREPRIPAR